MVCLETQPEPTAATPAVATVVITGDRAKTRNATPAVSKPVARTKDTATASTRVP